MNCLKNIRFVFWLVEWESASVSRRQAWLSTASHDAYSTKVWSKMTWIDILGLPGNIPENIKKAANAYNLYYPENSWV